MTDQIAALREELADMMRGQLVRDIAVLTALGMLLGAQPVSRRRKLLGLLRAGGEPLLAGLAGADEPAKLALEEEFARVVDELERLASNTTDW
ncbi:MAG: hypothetical protein ACOY3N_09035 [Bradyrhizobium sp.]|uniref:hypothetical protein n=1 Tax=Bradyrhizobium sp. TaxID=376 RepID=UPI003BEF5761